MSFKAITKFKGATILNYVGFEIVPAYYEFALNRLKSGKYLIRYTDEERAEFDLFSSDA